MKQNILIALAIIIPVIAVPFLLFAIFITGLSDSGERSNSSEAILSVFPGIALLLLLSIFLFTDLKKISTGKIVAIFIAGITTVRFRTPANIDDLRCQVMGKMVGVE
jgi:hypothetical protein